MNAKQREKVENYMVNNTDTLTIYTLYEYLFENFFTTQDLDNAIKRYNSGEKLEEILQSYYEIEQSFTPRNYTDGEIEYYMQKLHMSEQEIAVAEILDFRGIIQFDIIIDRISNGDNMTLICEEADVLNVACEMTTFNVSRDEVLECADELNVTEQEAFGKIVSAKKAKIKDKDIVKFLKANDIPGKKIKEHYKEKFNR